jgi:hypothetical protein
MKRLLRTLLTGLLLVAVPLQGYAAGAMLFCGSAHGQGEDVDQAAHGHGGAAHDHDATGATDVHAAAALDRAEFGHGACSVCVSCCSGAALPASTIATSFARPLAPPTPPDEHTAPAHASPRLERPPRIDLT